MTSDKATDGKPARKRGKGKTGGKLARKVPMPSNNPATNLLITDIVLRGAGSLLRRKVERRVAKASAKDDGRAEELLDGRTLLTSLGLYGASKLATRSLPGLAIVTGGLVAKTLYDRGKARQARLRKKRRPATKPPPSE